MPALVSARQTITSSARVTRLRAVCSTGNGRAGLGPFRAASRQWCRCQGVKANFYRAALAASRPVAPVGLLSVGTALNLWTAAGQIDQAGW
jgi:hypothetical protein